MAKETNAPKVEPFEQLYGRLEASVSKLEDGGLSLDDAIALYEEGMTLARECQQRLDEAEQKITKLRESFAPIARSNGTLLQDAPADVEYVTDDDPPIEDEAFS
jgi:exodeoxyribonuclease VII small subunit